MSNEPHKNRLPNTVKPKDYTLNVWIIPEKGVFSGFVEILVQILSTTRSITLHCQDLELGQVQIKSNQGSYSPKIHYNPKDKSIRLDGPRELSPGDLLLKIPFSGKLNQQMRGLYEARAYYQGVEERYAFTHFEPTDARRFFPCFDEPGFKATFRVTATVPEHLTVLSNMPSSNESRKDGLKTVSFQTTPLMSTYLLALAVGRLVSKTQTIAGTQVSVWAMPQDISLGEFALTVTQGVLPLLNTYFEIPYPYPKLDLIAVPDFAMGAMENWGAIFFRDSRLLVDEANASPVTKRIIANIITHEIIHQWFGNLVTMAWWNDLWLNEAFATWLACKIVDQWRPQWHSWEEFLQEKQTALNLDALDNSRPIISEVESSSDIEAMFDPLTYEKGAAVLRMFEHFLGEDTFRSGIRSYIKKYQFQNTLACDLWKSLEEVSKQPVETIAKDWLTQMGFPVLTFHPLQKNQRTLEIEQRKFSAHGRSQTSGSHWTIPMVIRYGDDSGIHSHRLLLNEKKTQISLPGEGPIQWVYLNGGEAGFYRIDPCEDHRKALQCAARVSLESAERVGFLNHTWASTQANDIPMHFLMETLVAFKGDPSRAVVETIALYLEGLSDHLISDTHRDLMSHLVKELLEPLWSQLGWKGKKGEDEEIRLTRDKVLWVLGSVARYPEIIEQVDERLERYWNHPFSLDPTLASTLVRLGAEAGGIERFKDYKERIQKAKNPEDRDRLLLALSDFPSSDLAKELMEMTLTPSIRGQDLWRPMVYLLSNPLHQETCWNFIKSHWTTLKEKSGSIGAQRIIQGTKNMWEQDWQEDISAFFKHPSNLVESASKALDQTLEWIKIGILFKAKQQEGLLNWLQKRYSKNSSGKSIQ